MKQDRWGEERTELLVDLSRVISSDDPLALKMVAVAMVVDNLHDKLADQLAQIEQRIEGMKPFKFTKNRIRVGSDALYPNETWSVEYLKKSEVKSILKEIGGRDE